MQVFNSFQEMAVGTGALQPQSVMSVFNRRTGLDRRDPLGLSGSQLMIIRDDEQQAQAEAEGWDDNMKMSDEGVMWERRDDGSHVGMVIDPETEEMVQIGVIKPSPRGGFSVYPKSSKVGWATEYLGRAKKLVESKYFG